MIVVAFDLRAMQLLASGNSPAVFGLLDLGSHRLEILRDRAQPVGLLHPQLSGVANLQPSER